MTMLILWPVADARQRHRFGHVEAHKERCVVVEPVEKRRVRQSRRLDDCEYIVAVDPADDLVMKPRQRRRLLCDEILTRSPAIEDHLFPITPPQPEPERSADSALTAARWPEEDDHAAHTR